MVKSECDFVGWCWGWCVEVSVIISFQCLNTRYSSAGYGVFHCGKRVIPLPNMGYSSEGYGVFRRRIWGIPLLDRGIPYGICYHWV